MTLYRRGGISLLLMAGALVTVKVPVRPISLVILALAYFVSLIAAAIWRPRMIWVLSVTAVCSVAVAVVIYRDWGSAGIWITQVTAWLIAGGLILTIFENSSDTGAGGQSRHMSRIEP
jgi:hypothetical protein